MEHDDSATPLGASQWGSLVDRVRDSGPAGFEELYEKFKGLRYLFWRYLGPDTVEDAYHSLIITAVTQIRRGLLRDPERLPTYLRSIARAQVLKEVQRKHSPVDLPSDGLEPADPNPSPESRVSRQEAIGIAERVLKALSPRDREVLIRFYLREETPEHIQEVLGLSATQFRLIKSRAKARFTELCRVVLEQKRLPALA